MMSRLTSISAFSLLVLLGIAPVLGQSKASSQGGSVRESSATDAITASEELFPDLAARGVQDTWITFDNTKSSRAKKAILVEAIDTAGNWRFLTTDELALLEAGKAHTEDFERKIVKFRVHWRERGFLGIWWPHRAPSGLGEWFEVPDGYYVYYATVVWNSGSDPEVKLYPKALLVAEDVRVAK